MGPNKSYSHARSALLLKRHIFTVNQAYVVVMQEESQRQLGVVEITREPMTMLAGKMRSIFEGKEGKAHL